MTTRVHELRTGFDHEFAAALPPPDPPSSDFLCIRAGDEPAAIPLADVASLHAGLRVVALPTRARELLGVASLRAAVVPIYDLRIALDLPAGSAARWTVLLRSRPVGFSFDGFDGHIQVPDRAIAVATQRGHVRGQLSHDGHPRSILDLASVLTAVEARWRSGGPAKEL